MTGEPCPETIVGLLWKRVERSPDEPACYRRVAPGRWSPATWADLWGNVERVAGGLARQALSPGDRLAILAPTCPEWQVAEFAGLFAGATIVGIDPHAPAEQVEYVLRHSEARCLIVQNSAQAEKIPECLRAEMRLIVFLSEKGGATTHPNQCAWSKLQATSSAPSETPPFPAPTAGAPATLIYPRAPRAGPRRSRSTIATSWPLAGASSGRSPRLAQTIRSSPGCPWRTFSSA